MSEYSFLIFTIMATSTIVAIKCDIWWMWLIGYFLSKQVRKVKVVTIEKQKDEENK